MVFLLYRLPQNFKQMVLTINIAHKWVWSSHTFALFFLNDCTTVYVLLIIVLRATAGLRVVQITGPSDYVAKPLGSGAAM
jgi:hypothetical protein